MDPLELTRLDLLWALIRVLLGGTFLRRAWIHGAASWSDWLVVAALAAAGAGLVFGIVMRFTAAGAAVLLMPVPGHPLVDHRLVLALVVLGIGFTTLGWRYGLGRWWSGTPLVQRHRWLA
jgi:thiosulfate dehydrogenase (quinone) large subunit